MGLICGSYQASAAASVGDVANILEDGWRASGDWIAPPEFACLNIYERAVVRSTIACPSA